MSRPLATRRALAIAVLACAPHLANAQARTDQVLPEVKVRGAGESADGPVHGYNATRSSTATKTDTPPCQAIRRKPAPGLHEPS